MLCPIQLERPGKDCASTEPICRGWEMMAVVMTVSGHLRSAVKPLADQYAYIIQNSVATNTKNSFMKFREVTKQAAITPSKSSENEPWGGRFPESFHQNIQNIHTQKILGCAKKQNMEEKKLTATLPEGSTDIGPTKQRF